MCEFMIKIRWNSEEDKILMENYPNRKKEDLLGLLPRRSWQSITSRASKILHISRFDNEKWTQQENELLLSCYKKTPPQELEHLFPNRTIGSIRTHAHLLGAYFTHRWSKHEDEILFKNYVNSNYEKLLKLLPRRSRESIRKRAERLGLLQDWLSSKGLGLNRSPSLVRSVRRFNRLGVDFSVIDTEEKAYLLGFFAADACVHENNLVINLASKDHSFLEKIRDLVDPNIEIKLKLVSCRVGGPKIYEQSSLCIPNKILITQLLGHGIHRNKSLSLKSPDTVPDELVRHWIRGYFDGDGCVTSNKKGDLIFAVAGTAEVMTYILAFIKSMVETKMSVRKQRNIYVISNSHNIAKIFLEAIYQGANIFLDRKYNLAKELGVELQ